MKIYFLNGPRKGETLEMLDQVLSVGRETDNTLSLLVGGVSRYHAKFEKNGDAWILSDLGSTNGTKVNGIKILAPQELKPGDMIYFGDQHIKVFENAPDESSCSASKIQTSASPPEQEIKIFSPEPDAGPFIKEPEPLNDTASEVFRREPQPVSPMTRTIPDVEQNQPQTPASYFSESLQEPQAQQPQTPHIGALSKINIFAKKLKTPENGAAPHAPRKHANLLFYVTVIGLAVIFISTYFMFEKINAEKAAMSAAKKDKTVKKKSNFTMFYRKQTIKNNNIFYFCLAIENNSLKFTVDDIKSNIHYIKTVKEPNERNLNDLEQLVRGTSFMALKQDSSPGPAKPESIRTLAIAYDDNLNEITVKDNFAQSSFEAIEAAIDDFAANYDLRAVSLTPEELKAEAEKVFTKAEELYANLEARPQNLREAIARYKITVEYLNPFSPKPAIWNEARKKQQEASALYEKKIKDIKFDFRQAMKLGDKPRAIELCAQMMLTANPESKDYIDYKGYKISLENEYRKQKKK